MNAGPSTRARGVLRLLEGRRSFIAAGLALLGFGRRAWAQLVDPSAPVRYAALTRPVKIPVDAVAAPWRIVPFVAEGMAGPRRVLISGVQFRRASVAAGHPDAAAALGAPQAERALRGAGASRLMEDTH